MAQTRKLCLKKTKRRALGLQDVSEEMQDVSAEIRAFSGAKKGVQSAPALALSSSNSPVIDHS